MVLFVYDGPLSPPVAGGARMLILASAITPLGDWSAFLIDGVGTATLCSLDPFPKSSSACVSSLSFLVRGSPSPVGVDFLEAGPSVACFGSTALPTVVRMKSTYTLHGEEHS